MNVWRLYFDFGGATGIELKIFPQHLATLSISLSCRCHMCVCNHSLIIKSSSSVHFTKVQINVIEQTETSSIELCHETLYEGGSA